MVTSHIFTSYMNVCVLNFTNLFTIRAFILFLFQGNFYQFYISIRELCDTLFEAEGEEFFSPSVHPIEGICVGI